jgi:hypothetical protein
MAHSHFVLSAGTFGRWRAAYRRVVHTSFATVAHYRYLWAVEGRTDPVLVPGRTGVHGGAIRPDDVERALGELVPLSGGRSHVDTERGHDSVLAMVGVRGPARELARLDGCSDGLIHDRMLGYLGAFGACGHWHLDWKRVYARETDAGLAFTLLRQHSPRLVDVLVGGGVPGRVARCPRHGTPVVHT